MDWKLSSLAVNRRVFQIRERVQVGERLSPELATPEIIFAIYFPISRINSNTSIKIEITFKNNNIILRFTFAGSSIFKFTKPLSISLKYLFQKIALLMKKIAIVEKKKQRGIFLLRTKLTKPPFLFSGNCTGSHVAYCVICQADVRESEAFAQERKNCFSAKGMHRIRFRFPQGEGHFGYWPISEVPNVRVMRAALTGRFEEGGLVSFVLPVFFPVFLIRMSREKKVSKMGLVRVLCES